MNLQSWTKVVVSTRVGPSDKRYFFVSFRLLFAKPKLHVQTPFLLLDDCQLMQYMDIQLNNCLSSHALKNREVQFLLKSSLLNLMASPHSSPRVTIILRIQLFYIITLLYSVVFLEVSLSLSKHKWVRHAHGYPFSTTKSSIK